MVSYETMAKHIEVGMLGEKIACEWLCTRGFTIVERNYNRKWGEIDIVARETSGKVRFIEVKTVSYETKMALERAVSRGTWRPEENVHAAKQARMGRAIQTWSMEHESEDWQIDIIALRLVPRERYCKIRHLENIVFSDT